LFCPVFIVLGIKYTLTSLPWYRSRYIVQKGLIETKYPLKKYINQQLFFKKRWIKKATKTRVCIICGGGGVKSNTALKR
jgi:hypothetical protein